MRTDTTSAARVSRRSSDRLMTPDDIAGDWTLGMALQRAAEFLDAVEARLDDVEAGRVAQTDRAVIAKGDAWNNGHAGLAEEAVSEVLGLQAERADVSKNVERALWTNSTNALDLGKALKHVLAANIEFLAHISHALLIAGERGKRSVLGE